MGLSEHLVKMGALFAVGRIRDPDLDGKESRGDSDCLAEEGNIVFESQDCRDHRLAHTRERRKKGRLNLLRGHPLSILQ